MTCPHCGCQKSFLKQSKDHQRMVRFCDNCARMIQIEKPPAVTDGSEGIKPTPIIQREEVE